MAFSDLKQGLGEPMLTHKPRLDLLNIGEAKILVEIELDEIFSKQIVLDDKLGNIFLVDVIYSWIPSTCERCTSSTHTSLPVMDDVPSEIIINEGTILSEHDPLEMTPLPAESIQKEIRNPIS
ncbi:unnamed protein product [Eruca vesicaria subsp. sativa]|uniref:DUF177 domain-containing protein n=1 Tax=Eruca vesicaria subsp. sativa TaxID=29727 RepID=A0ABC8LIN1_ERUVS|nr:unnamed protein product [Eruca vesicaria subsp. sativa]